MCSSQVLILLQSFSFTALWPRRCQERIKHTQIRSVHGTFPSLSIRHTLICGFPEPIPASFCAEVPERFREAGRQHRFVETASHAEVTTVEWLRYKEFYRLSRECVT